MVARCVMPMVTEQQNAVLNNCAFHTILQAESVKRALKEQQEEGAGVVVWPFEAVGGRLVLPTKKIIYGGNEQETQKMRKTWERRLEDEGVKTMVQDVAWGEGTGTERWGGNPQKRIKVEY